jgi:hypothetical protein
VRCSHPPSWWRSVWQDILAGEREGAVGVHSAAAAEVGVVLCGAAARRRDTLLGQLNSRHLAASKVPVLGDMVLAV